MRRVYILMVFAALFFAASCNKEDELKVEQLQKELEELQQQASSTVPDAQDVTVPEDVEYAFAFDQSCYGVDAGGSVTINYTLPAASSLEVVANDGWSAEVNAASATQGSIVVTAPDPALPSNLVATATTEDGLSYAVTLPVLVRDPYSDATRTDVAAMAYYCLYPGLATDYHFQKLAECGMNMLTIEQVDNWQEQLNLAHKYGMKGILFVNGVAGDYYRSGGRDTKLDEVINEAKSYPALAGYQIFDEPSTINIGQINFEKDRIEELDPDHPVYVNLHPASASVYSLGVEDYFEYVETFVTRCNLKFITFDQYPVFSRGLDASWPRSLAAVYQVSRRHNIPFWAFTLCCREDQREDPSLENIRLQCNTNLAYGAQVNQFFVYRSTSGTDMAPLQTWEWKDGIVDGEQIQVVKYTPFYDYCKTYCHEMHNRGYVFAGSKVTKVRNTYAWSPWNENLGIGDLPPQINKLATSRECLISFVENNGNKYIAVVSGLWKSAQVVEIDLNEMVYMIDHNGEFTPLQPGVSSFTLEGGDMLVFKYR